MFRSRIFSFLFVCVLLVPQMTLKAAITISYGHRNSYGNAYNIPSDDFIVEAGGCFHSIPNSTAEANVNRYIKNNFQIAGSGYYIESSAIQETSGAIRVCSGVTDASLLVNTWFGGTITITADATIGIAQLAAVKDTYLTNLAAAEAVAGTARLTLRASDASDTFFIVANNDSFTNPITIAGNGRTQIGKISSTAVTVYDQDNNPSTRLAAQTFTFDGSAGSLGSGAISIDGSSSLIFERTGNVTIANTIGGTGSLSFKGDAVYTFSAASALTGLSNTNNKPIEIGEDATVKVYGSNTQSSSNQKYTGSGTLIAAYNSDSSLIQGYPGLANLSNFTGRLLLAGGYRWDPGTGFSGTYSLGTKEGGQMWLTTPGNYNLTLYVEGMGKQGNEAFGAIRMTGQYNGSQMTNLGGTVYLTGDTRVSAANVSGIAGETHNLGMISAKILSEDTTNKAPLRICGLAYNGAYTQMVLTSSENDYGKTYVEGRGILQIGFNGTINGTAYTGTTGVLGSGDVVFTAVDGSTATTSDLGGKVIFARSNAYAIANAFQGAGALEFTAGGNYSLTDTNALTNFTGPLTVADGAALTLADQTVPAGVSFVLTGGTLLGGATIQGAVTTDSASAVGTGLTFAQDLEINGKFLADLSDTTGPLLTSAGDLELVDGAAIRFMNEEGFNPGDSVVLMKGNAASFSDLDLDSLLIESSLPWTLSLTSSDGAMFLNAQVQLPEPSSMVLALLCIAGLFVFRKIF
ncbi:MAG: hypothetical protein K6C40_06780 [Thermoguttaceae bacterium]|nr:hypothetical protein [Thermoguttaceae bacterium]